MTPGEAFVYRLCLALGFPHPDYLLPLLSARQLTEWERFYEQDPWGDQRADLRTGILACAALAPHSKRRLKPLDFMPYREKREQTVEEMQAVMEDAIRGANRSA